MAKSKTTIADLDAELDALDKQRLLLKEKIKQVMALRNHKIREAQLDYWGLNEGQYEAAKAKSRASSRPAHVCLNEARLVANQDARDTQTAMADAAKLKTKVEGV